MAVELKCTQTHKRLHTHIHTQIHCIYNLKIENKYRKSMRYIYNLVTNWDWLNMEHSFLSHYQYGFVCFYFPIGSQPKFTGSVWRKYLRHLFIYLDVKNNKCLTRCIRGFWNEMKSLSSFDVCPTPAYIAHTLFVAIRDAWLWHYHGLCVKERTRESIYIG